MYTLGLGRYDSPYGQEALRAVNQRNAKHISAKQTSENNGVNPKYKNKKNTTSPLGVMALMLLSGIVAYKGKGAIQATGQVFKSIGKFFTNIFHKTP